MSILDKREISRRSVLKVQLVGANQAQRAEVKTDLASLDDPPLEVRDLAPDLNVPIDDSVDVLMVMFNGQDETSLAYLSSYARREIRPVLFALLHDRSSDLMKRVLRAGADELLFLPLDPGNAVRALLKINESRRRAGCMGGGSIVSVTSMVGGVGVTSLAANLGLALHYACDKRVVMIDLDLQKGALSGFLNLERQRTVMGLTGGSRKVDSIQLESALTKHPSGIYLLAAPSRIEDSELLTDVTVGALLELVRQLFDFVIVDCGTHIDANTVAAWERSTHLFYVLDQSIAAAQGAWRFIDLCGRLGLPQVEPGFVLNRFADDSPISEGQLSQTLANEFFAKIPRDEKTLERAQLLGRDLWQVAPSSSLAKAYEAAARRLEMGLEMTDESTNSLVSRFLSAIGARA